jgi:hypothetical protein
MTDGLSIRLELLESDDLLVALAYSWLSMAVASQGRYGEALVPQFKAGEILECPAGQGSREKADLEIQRLAETLLPRTVRGSRQDPRQIPCRRRDGEELVSASVVRFPPFSNLRLLPVRADAGTYQRPLGIRFS